MKSAASEEQRQKGDYLKHTSQGMATTSRAAARFDLSQLRAKIKREPKLLAEKPHLAMKYLHYLKSAGHDKSLEPEEIDTMIEYMNNYKEFKTIEEEESQDWMAVDEAKLVGCLLERPVGPPVVELHHQ